MPGRQLLLLGHQRSKTLPARLFSTLSPMSVPFLEIARMLRDALVDDGSVVSGHLQEFQEWKADWRKEEFRSWFFGKD
jgi:hypothetical protein